LESAFIDNDLRFNIIDDLLLRTDTPDESCRDDESGNTGLIFAAQYLDEEHVRYLIEYGSDKNAVNHNGWNCFHAAAVGGKIDTLIYLSNEFGSDSLRSTDNYGRNALTLACAKGEVKTVEYLIEEQGFEIYNYGEDCFHSATEFGNLNVLFYLYMNSLDQGDLFRDWVRGNSYSEKRDGQVFLDFFLERYRY